MVLPLFVTTFLKYTLVLIPLNVAGFTGCENRTVNGAVRDTPTAWGAGSTTETWNAPPAWASTSAGSSQVAANRPKRDLKVRFFMRKKKRLGY